MQNPYASPQEQLRQVMAWYPNKKLYKRLSNRSGKPIVSVYAPSALCPVYAHDEWYADDWDPPFLDANPQISFFTQFQTLQRKAPVVSLLSHRQENAEYCHDVEGVKNGYIVFDAIDCRDVYYSVRIYNSRSCVDVYWVMDCELLYDCVYMFSSYNCRYSFNCRQVSDSFFLFNCHNVRNSFMCSNLRNKEYWIFNKPSTKEEFENFVRTMKLSNSEVVAKLKVDFLKMLRATPIPPAFLKNCESVDGNYLSNAHNVHRGFESFDVKDCENIFQCAKGRDIVGSFMCNDRVERCFQCVATGIDSNNVSNCAFVWHGSNMEYCYLCIGCKDCFGSIGLRNKQHYIFNKPYAKEEYFKIVAELVNEMKKRVEYGFFFPPEMSPFPYEDTIAYDFFSDESKPIEMPLSYTPQESLFYKTHGIPFPKHSFSERYRERLRLMDTGFIQNRGTYYRHPEEKNIVAEEEYLKGLQ